MHPQTCKHNACETVAEGIFLVPAAVGKRPTYSTWFAAQALLLICYWAAGLWILKRARISSPRDRVKLISFTLVLALGIVVYAWADAEELFEYQTFWESGSDEFEKGLGLKTVTANAAALGLSAKGSPRGGGVATQMQGVHGTGEISQHEQQYSDHGVHVYPDSDDPLPDDDSVHAYPDSTHGSTHNRDSSGDHPHQ